MNGSQERQRRRTTKAASRVALRMALCAALLAGWAWPARALELQLGAASTQVGETDHTHAATTSMPYIALGGLLGGNVLAFVEAGWLNYNVSTSERPKGHILPGELNVSGTSVALLIVPRFERFDLRLGYGHINYGYDFRIDPNLDAALTAVGFGNFRETLQDSSGTQLIAGLDFFLFEHLTFGVEHRSVTIKPVVRDTGNYQGFPFVLEEELDLSHSMTNFRLLLRF